MQALQVTERDNTQPSCVTPRLSESGQNSRHCEYQFVKERRNDVLEQLSRIVSRNRARYLAARFIMSGASDYQAQRAVTTLAGGVNHRTRETANL